MSSFPHFKVLYWVFVKFHVIVADEKHQEKKSKEPPTKSKKKLTDRWSNKHDKQQFTNPWLLNNLKGHTGEILDMDYSSNGKFLATCADG